uniref:Uncharacterized protein n=1 Tax=Cacopsylla melanoneura TaxID=428564 RepID=A0A8D8QAZ8_9HEMI
MSVAMLKRGFARAKEELTAIEKLVQYELTEDVNNEVSSCKSSRVQLQRFKEILVDYVDQRNLLEKGVDESVLSTLDLTVSDKLHSTLNLMLMKIESKIVDQETKIEKDSLDQEREFMLKQQDRELELAKVNSSEKTKLEELKIKKLELELQSPQNTQGSSTSNVSVSSGCSVGFLPKIELLKFDGSKPERFREFLECFNSIIDSRQDLTDSVKLQYLKMQIGGKAAKLL